MRKTKIICTLGPSTDQESVLKKIMLSGMEVARFNFSHQTHEKHKARLSMVTKISDQLGLPVALLADLKGPEIRTGDFETKEVELIAGNTFTLTTEKIIGNDKISHISFEGLPNDVTKGDKILIDDGLIELQVDCVTCTEIHCTIINGGIVSNHKGINVPGIELSMPYISSNDRADIRFACSNNFDFIAASFTRTADDIKLIREELNRIGNQSIKIIAKIENSQGVENIDEIIDESDGIMVARGDLGVEIATEEIPVIQKKLIKKCYAAGKQVITATQMLESMMKNPRPTRAETTDVANAIYDGTSAIMLSGETAAGLYPVEAVKTMARIAIRTEQDIDYISRFNRRGNEFASNVTNAISHATCTTAHDLNAAAIITVTKSGTTARMISKFRPASPIIGCTTTSHIQHQLNMSWGIIPIVIGEQKNTDMLFQSAIEKSVKAGLLHDGDLVVITAGVPIGVSGTTNLLKVHVVGEPL